MLPSYYSPSTRDLAYKIILERSNEIQGKNKTVEETVSQLTEAHSGVMIAVFIPPTVGETIAIPDGEAVDALHCTLLYIKGVDFNNVVQAVRNVIERSEVVAGCIGGIGRFNPSESSDGAFVHYVSFDSVQLASMREKMLDALLDAGIHVPMSHGYTPHITLKYSEDPFVQYRGHDSEVFNIELVSIVQGENRVDIPLGCSRG